MTKSTHLVSHPRWPFIENSNGCGPLGFFNVLYAEKPSIHREDNVKKSAILVRYQLAILHHNSLCVGFSQFQLCMTNCELEILSENVQKLTAHNAESVHPEWHDASS